jgi:sulfate permease, SulP family
MTTLERTRGLGNGGSSSRTTLDRFIPALRWISGYRRGDLAGDLIAGIIVTIMLVPQGMAYAMLAGLPPQVGLYASILPLVAYGLLGSSRALAVGPVAIVSLITASGLGALAEQGSAGYVQLALTLALLVAIIQVGMGLVRLGFLVNFLSHPVLVGFTSAAALVIGFSQARHLFGFAMPDTEAFHAQILAIIARLDETNPATLAISLATISILLFFKGMLGGLLTRRRLPERVVAPITRSAPLVVVLIGTLLVWALRLDQRAGVAIVGAVPAGLPALTNPLASLDHWRLLLPTALTIGFVGYMESISVAKSLASKRRQKVDANQELVGLGMANVAAAVTGGYPVTGGFSRSVVNFTAGANTPLASIITAALIALTVVFLTPLFFFLPRAVLAAVIVVAVASLIDTSTIRHIWHYNKLDAASLIVTFVAVLELGVEAGIGVGVLASVLLYLWRTSRPHVAILGRLGQSESYKNVLRHQVQTCPRVVAVRVDESLYFANTKFLEDTLLQIVADQPQVEYLILDATAVNFIDASALETLEALHRELLDAGVALYLASIKGPVMDRLEAIGFVEKIGSDHFFLTTHDAMRALNCT